MEEERIKLVLEAMTLGYLIQDQTDYCVFMYYSGHVDSFDIDIRESKENWHNKVCETEIKDKFLEIWHKDKEDHLAYLKARISVLKEILETNSIPYEYMEEHVEHVVTHSF